MLQRLKPVAICWSSVGLGQQIARKLLDRELIEGLIAVEGVDHPIAIGPDFAIVVEMDAVRVGVAGGIEPVARPMFAPALRGEQLIDVVLVGVGRGVVDECFDLLGRRRQARQIEAQAPGQRAAIGFGGRREAALFELRQDEMVDADSSPKPRFSPPAAADARAR